MFSLGWPEVLLILGVALVIFGPKNLPQLGKSFAKTLQSFKTGMNEAQSEMDQDDR
jgi:sec-independent protein translocase protein TatA